MSEQKADSKPLESTYFPKDTATCEVCGWRAWHINDKTAHCTLHKLARLVELIEEMRIRLENAQDGAIGYALHVIEVEEH